MTTVEHEQGSQRDDVAERLLRIGGQPGVRPRHGGRLGDAAGQGLPRREPGVEHPVRHRVLGGADRGPAQGADAPGSGVGGQHRHLVRDDPAADGPARRLRKDPTSAGVQWALTEIAEECRHSIMFARGAQKLGAPAYRPHRARGGAGAGVQDPRVRRGGVRGDPRRRGGPRRHAARLDAGRAGRALRPHHQQHPCRRGVPAHEVRPRRRPASGCSGAGPVRRRINALVIAIAVVLHRHQHGEQGRLRQRRARREARARARRRPTSTTSR